MVSCGGGGSGCGGGYDGGDFGCGGGGGRGGDGGRFGDLSACADAYVGVCVGVGTVSWVPVFQYARESF